MVNFIFALLLTAVSARCTPGVDWQILAYNPNLLGAKTDESPDSFTTAYLNVSFHDARMRHHSIKSEVAKFGDGPIGPASGYLVDVMSPNGARTGCELPLKSAWGKIPSEPWIALIQRGDCNFETKVENALKHNAAAVIIYNDRESPTLDKMSISPTYRNISSVFTYKWKGDELVRLLDGGKRVYMQITVATHCSMSNSQINRTSVLFVSISFIVLMVISLAWLVFYYIQRFRYMHAKNRLSRRLCSAAKTALSKVPTKQVAGEDKEVLGDECCAVCIEPYRVTDDLRVLPCTHEFHKGCIDPWLLEHRTCPMCKMDILKHYGFVFTGSQESILQIEEDRSESIGSGEFANNRAPSGVRSEPVSRVGTPTLHLQGSYYTMQPATRGEDRGSECCSMCPHHKRQTAQMPRTHSNLSHLDRSKLIDAESLNEPSQPSTSHHSIVLEPSESHKDTSTVENETVKCSER